MRDMNRYRPCSCLSYVSLIYCDIAPVHVSSYHSCSSPFMCLATAPGNPELNHSCNIREIYMKRIVPVSSYRYWDL